MRDMSQLAKARIEMRFVPHMYVDPPSFSNLESASIIAITASLSSILLRLRISAVCSTALPHDTDE